MQNPKGCPFYEAEDKLPLLEIYLQVLHKYHEACSLKDELQLCV